MTQNLRDILNKREQAAFATDAGTLMHARLRRVIIDDDTICGDADLVREISARPDVVRFFVASARTEVPIAGTVRNRFISRRIDRLLIDDVARTIDIMDYKTDTDPTARRPEYVRQLCEYADLLRQIYPSYKIHKYILWAHNWVLEEVC